MSAQTNMIHPQWLQLLVDSPIAGFSTTRSVVVREGEVTRKAQYIYKCDRARARDVT